MPKASLPAEPVKEDLMEIQDEEFYLIRDLIHRAFGIHLSEAKRAMLVRRLQQWLQTKGFPNFREYHKHLLEDGKDLSFSELANRITTNYTFFNREPEHFQFFQETLLPEISREHYADRDLRIWSAGASTGEEAYMLVMCMMDHFGAQYSAWKAGVLATDISKRALEQAESGLFHEDQIRQLPTKTRAAYFKGEPKNQYRLVSKVRDEVTFRRFNLLNKLYPFKKPFDAIFCRNVMIYFDTGVKEHVTTMLHHSLRPGGYLFIGHSESLTGNRNAWETVGPSVFRKL